MSETPLLQVDGLKVHFPIHGGVLYRRVANVHAVDGVSLKIGAGETLGLVGESGCGKTTVGRAILRLYKPTAGQITFQDHDLSKLTNRELRPLRRDLQMIFQDPYESLNTRHTVGNIIAEPMRIHGIGDGKSRRARVKELLELVGLPASAINKFPHEFSGGQRQRIGIARAIALKPKLIVCDEPVSALDVSIQSQVINLLLDLQKQLSLSYLFIAHDLAVVKHVSDRVAVMYLGRIVEYADAATIYTAPRHPYTRALLAAIPVPDPSKRHDVAPLAGEVPSPIFPPSGCHFHPRCPHAQERCRQEVPDLRDNGGGQSVACHFADELA